MTNGQSGEAPEWYFPLKAALFLNVSPDDAIRMPVFWIEAAAIVSQVESSVREKRESMKAKRAKKRG